MTLADRMAAWVTDEVPLLDGRIHPISLPAKVDGATALPACDWLIVSSPHEPTQDGPGLVEMRVRFRVWTELYNDLEPLVGELKTAFDGRHDGPFRSSVVDSEGPEGRDRPTGRYWRIVDVLGSLPGEYITEAS